MLLPPEHPRARATSSSFSERALEKTHGLVLPHGPRARGGSLVTDQKSLFSDAELGTPLPPTSATDPPTPPEPEQQSLFGDLVPPKPPRPPKAPRKKSAAEPPRPTPAAVKDASDTDHPEPSVAATVPSATPPLAPVAPSSVEPVQGASEAPPPTPVVVAVEADHALVPAASAELPPLDSKGTEEAAVAPEPTLPPSTSSTSGSPVVEVAPGWTGGETPTLPSVSDQAPLVEARTEAALPEAEPLPSEVAASLGESGLSEPTDTTLALAELAEEGTSLPPGAHGAGFVEAPIEDERPVVVEPPISTAPLAVRTPPAEQATEATLVPTAERVGKLVSVADHCLYAARPDVVWPKGWEEARNEVRVAALDTAEPTPGLHCFDCPLLGACPVTVGAISAIVDPSLRMGVPGAYPLTTQAVSLDHRRYLRIVGAHVKAWLERLEDALDEPLPEVTTASESRRSRKSRGKAAKTGSGPGPGPGSGAG